MNVVVSYWPANAVVLAAHAVTAAVPARTEMAIAK